jgi:folate-binding protein YgfZ
MASPNAFPIAWFDRSSRPRIAVAGPDRAKFLHNLTTNDVKRLAEGSGQESFVTSPQGKVLAYVTLLADVGKILLRTDQDALEALLPHLVKYGVFDEVTIENETQTTFEYHVMGPSAAEWLGSRGVAMPEESPLRQTGSSLDGIPLRVVRESPTGRPGFTLVGPVEGAITVRATLLEGGIPELGPEDFEPLRIEAGTPLSGRDVTAANLPQEVDRDARAINFVKGCYLGQETVARLDALGHVNRIFRGLRFEGSAVPPAGTPLLFEGKPVGSVTSSAFSPGWGVPIGLGYVRVAQAEPGTTVIAAVEGEGEIRAVVGALPMLPPGG